MLDRIIVFILMTVHVSGQVSVKLLDTALLVDEGQQFQLRVQKIGLVTSVVNVVVSVKRPLDTGGDFVGSSQVGSFYPGGPDVVAVTFTVNDDSLPEVEETFTFELSAISSGVNVDTPFIAAITIGANDDAYGVFGFIDTTVTLVTETDISLVNIRVGRDRGTNGQVTVTYVLNSTEPDAIPGIGGDITPKSGVLTFQPEEAENSLQLRVIQDNIPENNEEFTLRLTGATKGARVLDTVMTIIIQANDAPIRFQQAEYRYDEGPGIRKISIPVLRGLEADGQSRIGSVNGLASVDFSILSDTATDSLDFKGPVNRQLVFSPGDTQGYIEIDILDDSDPEVEESFQLLLSNPVGDVIAGSPFKATIYINGNDYPNGVISLRPGNDGISLPLVQVNEDTTPSISFTVLRNNGTFGTVTVQWEIYRNDTLGGGVTTDIISTVGSITFQAGQGQGKINVTLSPDTVPEPTERFVLRLLPGSVNNGAKVDGIIEGIILIEDSDNYYGTVDFGENSQQQIIVETAPPPITNPRHLQLTMRRAGHNQGSVRINMTVVYSGSGDTQDVLEKVEWLATMTTGADSLTYKVPISSSAFLSVGGKFTATLTGVDLNTIPSLGAYNTPVLGSKKIVEIPVTINQANGEIGFQNTYTITVSEPENSPYPVNLKLSREGTSGQATISWSLAGSGNNSAAVTQDDTGPTSGTVVMAADKSETDFSILINPDDVPELSEEITVTLTFVNPSDTQRLKYGSTQVKIIILENDNPGGTFQFSSEMQDSYQVQEGSAPIDIVVTRSGGSLLRQFVQYTVVPNGAVEFYGYTNVLRFDPGVNRMSAALLPIADGVPEKEEAFTLSLRSYGNNSATIGSRSQISITVLENDNPYGLILFEDDPPVVYLDESTLSRTISHSISVRRSKGSFGSVSVSWDIIPNDQSADITPMSGTITYGDRQDQGSILISTLADDIPEGAENFTIQLKNPTGGAILGSPSTFTVIINKNDFPVYFSNPVYYVAEGSVVTITIKREGDASQSESVKYKTLDGSALVGDYNKLTNQDAVFGVGQTEVSFLVTINEDDLPEGNETFYIEIFQIMGDLVATQGTNCSIVILANDEAYGVFRFMPPLAVTAEEGSHVDLTIWRDRGAFGEVEVSWEVIDAITNTMPPDNSEFEKSNDTVYFDEGTYQQTLRILPRSDSAPEKQRKYIVKLTDVEVVVGRSGVQNLAKLSDTNTQVILTIEESDDPYGRFAFTLNSTEVTIAEDFYPGEEAKSTARFNVERRQGGFGNVQVVWEFYTDPVGVTMPTVYDLMILANPASDVSRRPQKRRIFTGTDVMYFTGAVNSYLTISSKYQPPPEELKNGYSISAWIQPFSDLNSYIVAKTTDDGSRFFYTLKVTTGGSGAIFLFGYAVSGSSSNQQISMTTSKNLKDGQWHHILVTVDSGAVKFFLNGQLIGSKTLGSQPLIDLTGKLYVGAIPPGNERFIGYLQDVRIYTRKLTDVEIKEIFALPAQKDLTPVSGYLSFHEALREQTIIVTSTQDSEEESSELFTIRLLTANNGGALSHSDSTARLTIEKSDNANGVFSIRICSPNQALTENAVISCTIERQRGDDGDVTISWAVFQSVGGGEIEASQDFVNSKGTITFPAGERLKTVTLTILDDDLPEIDEIFHVRLVSVSSGDGSTGSTNTSGASIDLTKASSVVTILKNDHSNGVLQFSNRTNPPSPGGGIIPISTVEPIIKVFEEAGTLALMVVRAQGTAGYVTVEWRTTDGTAKSSGNSGSDYKADVGKLEFKDGQQYHFINIDIIDNNKPETDKTFYVQLLNPTNGATLDVASTVTIVIKASDGAFGKFQFNNSALNVETEELGDSGYKSVFLQVDRLQGSIGSAIVTWEVIGNQENDFIEQSGTLTFAHGQVKHNLEIKVRADTLPELDESYQIQLKSVDQGELGASDRLVSVLTILANDDPYGLFVFPSDMRPLQVEETYKNISLTINRLQGTFGTVDVYYRTLGPSETHPMVPSTVRRAEAGDYRATEGMVRFLPTETEKAINVTIMDDTDPENDESFYVILINSTLQSSPQPRQVANSPRIGVNTEMLSQVMIMSNDIANGVLELSPISVSILENSTTIGVKLIRRGGTFGQVTVKFRVINGTAKEHEDFEVLSTTAILVDGAGSVDLPVRIINDNVPESNETFYIELLKQITGGGVLGTDSTTMAVVNIQASDDPVGAFEFAVDRLVVEEPEGGTVATHNVTIVRTGGSSGVVTVTWEALLNGASAASDISPVSGSVFFVSYEMSHTIPIQILPDDIPESQEEIKFTIKSTSGSGTIGLKRELTLVILPNDNPHGIVQFSQSVYTLNEMSSDSDQELPLKREGGLFGRLRVSYLTKQTDIVSDATQDGSSVLSYFNVPLDGSRELTGSLVDVSSAADPVDACSKACIRSAACKAFEVSVSLKKCAWYSTDITNSLKQIVDFKYYSKMVPKVNELFARRATEGVDFGVVTNGYTYIEEGVNIGSVIVSIKGDNLPELDEKFIVQLTSVEVISGVTSTKYPPKFGTVTMATAVIKENDNAFGEFTVVSDSPSAVQDGHILGVEERDRLAVDLIVERKGGNLGDVSIDWYIDQGASTATYGKDFTGDGATLQFSSGAARKLITVTILDDNDPELNKTVVIKLRNPKGGAQVSQDATVTIVILENDNVGGIVGFGTSALVGKEGTNLTLTVVRRSSAHGTVMVDWQTKGINDLDPTLGFSKTNGTIVFLPGDQSKQMQLSVLQDNKPEVTEEYQVLLQNIRTLGVGPSGAAIIDPQYSTATITIDSSNYPHGLLQFSHTSLEVIKEEQDITINLQIERKFGSIGAIRVSYEIKEGSITPLSDQLQAATAGVDFEAQKGYIDIGDGESFATVKVIVKDDTTPELNEAFIVELTGVTLLDNSLLSNMPPQLGATDLKSEIIISANDGTKGVVSFASDSYSVAVDEITKNITLTVLRDQGTFGDITVFCYAQSITTGATRGEDYQFIAQELAFADKESRKYILIEIFNDDIPEPDEIFEVILASPQKGAILGTPIRANVTILANDDSSGHFSFETNSPITIEETNGATKGEAVLKITRGPGVYGTVNVPYKVTPEVASNTHDISPMQSIIVFTDRQPFAEIRLEAVDDIEPEQVERFTVTLLQPTDGGLLGDITEKVIIVNPNDSPNGLIQIYARGTTNKTISVDESIGLLHFDIQRSQGTDGKVTVDMATQPGTAITNTDITTVTLTPLQIIPATQVVNWYSYTMNGSVYVAMLTNFRVGEFTTDIGSDGSAEAINVDRLFHSTIFRWQGELIPVQTIETDTASAAVSFKIDGNTYLAISNTGNVRRYQAKSRIYKVNSSGTLVVLQELSTSGAKDVTYFSSGNDHFLVLVNSKDNNGNTLVPVDIFKWDKSIGMFTFTPWQQLTNQGAEGVAVFEMEGVVYMVVANNYNSEKKTYLVDSIIYKLNSNQKFSEHQRVRTEGAIDVTHVLFKSLNLLMFANNRGDSISSPQKSWVYRWDSTTQMFFKHSDLDTYRVEDVEVLMGGDGIAYLIVSNSIGNSEIFSWHAQDQKFISMWTGPPTTNMVPVLIPQTSGPLPLVAIGSIGAAQNVTLYQLVKTKDSDFSPRTITMSFEPGQRTLHTTVQIIQDNQPEEKETFYVTLTNPTGGAEIGPHNMITVDILSNDNANGEIEFPPSSLEVLVTEEDGKDNLVEIMVLRKFGFFGRVVVKWMATGDQNGLLDITPLEGTIEFPDGQSQAFIKLTILNDNLAELPEVTYIRLTEIIESGSTEPNKGAIIGKSNVAKMIVQANDSPYGVILWERESIVLPEPEGTDFTQEVYITRQQGKMGQLQISFQTGIATGYPVDRRAVSGEDYIARQSTVVMQENVTRVPIQLVIKQDSMPEADESFVVNITGVSVMGLTPPAGAEPSVKVPGNILVVTITENDDARGLVEFDVTTNIEGRIDTYEEYGKNTTISLKVKRKIGVLGTVTVSWQAEPREATYLDFGPPSGSVMLMDGQESGEIIITIMDDTDPEEMETFDIKLLSVVGGSSLGPNKVVRVAILKNDSPNGLFRFVQKKVTVKESKSDSDPEGEVTLDIERMQGKEGVVNLQWRLNAEAVNDFIEPIAGTIKFGEGEIKKSISLRTKMDNILEGEEKFLISLISADNNADISHSGGDAVIVLLPDPGSAGTVMILPDYRTVYIGEPGESSSMYNGQTDILLSRGAGIYGDIAVTWTITPRDLDAFMQVEGTAQFGDLQPTAKIVLQSKDDTAAELRRIYTLQINSATNGASISSVPGSFVSNVVYVASDYPHGLFEFSLPEITPITENTAKVNIPIIRQYGRNNQVLISYTTTPGTAEEYKDFYPASGTLIFQHNERQKNVEITIAQDDLPEGPEMFYLNLTSARLSIPSNNNYTEINGLRLDMAPAIGPIGVKTILIQKNDNAEGTIEFQSDHFTVLEESGVAKIPLVRKGGNYGSITVSFSVTGINATAGVDYVVGNTKVKIEDKESKGSIDIVLRDDSDMEYAEQFVITINSVSGGDNMIDGALLGTITKATITIAKSDYPNGMFGFKGPLQIIMDNPVRQVQTTLTIERSGGHQGQQTVNWRLLGPNNPQRVLLETNDIFYISNNQETTSGHLVWENGESGAKTITLYIKPYSSWEVQKIFVVEIVTVSGFPNSVGDGEIGPNTGKTTVTIRKNGDPSGIIQFSGVSLSERTVEEPSGISPLELQFPIQRKDSTGVIGSIQVFWEITGPFDTTADFQPKNGSVFLADEQRDSSFSIQILPDTLPELTETFKVILTSVQGGAEIDTSNNEAVFHIRYNDHPHGLFGLIQSQQAIHVDPSDLVRSVFLNFTRHQGTFGSVTLTFAVSYDIPQSGVVLGNTGGPVTFAEGQTSVRVSIPIEGNGFLAVDTTFTATLRTVDYLGQGVTDPPAFQPTETEAKISVPQEAANSVIGFRDLIAGVDEASNTATMTLHREGTYGTVTVPWQIGYPSGQDPVQGSLGSITPSTGTVTIPHGMETKSFAVTVTAVPSREEYFVVHLPHIPSTTVSGGTRLDKDKKIVQIEPHGVIRFAANSIKPVVSELTGKAYLYVQRIFGSQGKIEVKYRSQGISADRNFDYITTETNAVIMEPGQTSSVIQLQVLQDNHPEEEETFHVNLTHVEKYPTELVPKISPRLSTLYSSSLVTIEESNDPYGILSVEPSAVSVEEEFKKVNLTIQRTGGLYGTVSVVVRTVGGGEIWTSQIVATSSDSNDTITEILGNRDVKSKATGGLDYEILDTKVQFLQNQMTKTVSLTILADSAPEADETVVVYLTQPTGGARIALGSPDGDKKGFSIVTILHNDVSNGIIGFSESSKALTVNEDTAPTFTLQLSRINAYFGEVEVSWKAKVHLTSTTTEDVVLANQLVKTAGTVICPAEQSSCTFDVSLKNDNIPENQSTFIILLTDTGKDAELDYSSAVANITVESSDFVHGLIQFTEDSRIIVVHKTTESVQLKVERIKGLNYDVNVSYQTWMMNNKKVLYDIDIYPAYQSQDFSQKFGLLSFVKNTQDIKYIDVALTPRTASNNPFPKQFYVDLKNPTNNASIHPQHYRSTVLIVQESNLPIWRTIINQETTNNDTDILRMLVKLDLIVKENLDPTELSLVEKILENILDEGQTRKMPDDILNELLNIMCTMLDPTRTDATRGRASLGLLMEKLSYTQLTGKPCSSPQYPDMSTLQYCLYAKVSAARWPLQKVHNFKYKAQKHDYFRIPEEIVDPPQGNCVDFHIIEYSSELWFMTSDQPQLLSNKIINFGLKGRPSTYSDKPAVYSIHTTGSRIATRQAQCVFYDYGSGDWVNPSGWCQVTNNIAAGTDDFVDCSCKHLTHYAVKATAVEMDVVGYSTWFFIACFFCMICMALAIVVHHICSMLHAMFSANLLMHMCFACFATQLCYIVAAYASPNDILIYNKFDNNYRCIVMGLFLHYFFLTQFTWILAQAMNYWKILVMNDEHTDRKYVFFFLVGWGSPAVILSIFYTVTYNLYKYVYDLPVDRIYGDVNNNGQMCFMTNAYAGLGGLIIPVILILIAVGVVFMKAFQVTPQWQAYDDIYRGRYNINEIRTLLSFWGVITMTWFWGGLHLAYGQLWMLVLFCIFNIIQGVMALVLYTILRNPMIQKCFGPQKSGYPANTTGDGVSTNNHTNTILDINSLKGSRASILNESWEKDSLHTKSTMKVKRTLPINRNIYVTPPVFVPSTTVTDENPDEDLDELLFALKNDSFVPSETSSIASEKTSDLSSKIDKYEMRRISIADTHL